MKVLLVAFPMIFANAFALENLSDMKRMANDSIGREMSELSTHKNCVNNAKTVTAFKACKYDIDQSEEMQKEEEKEIKKKVDEIEVESTEQKEEVMDNKKTLEQSY